MEGRALISSQVLARYAADAAREVEGVSAIVDGHLRRQRGVKVTSEEGGGVAIELHVLVQDGVSIPPIGREVQRRVRQYLKVMADVEPARVEVIVAGVESAPR